MLKMKFSAKWTAIAIATLMIGLDPLAAGATMKGEAAVTIAQVTSLAERSGQNPVVIARADRSDAKDRKKVKARKARLKPPTKNDAHRLMQRLLSTVPTTLALVQFSDASGRLVHQIATN